MKPQPLLLLRPIKQYECEMTPCPKAQQEDAVIEFVAFLLVALVLLGAWVIYG